MHGRRRRQVFRCPAAILQVDPQSLFKLGHFIVSHSVLWFPTDLLTPDAPSATLNYHLMTVVNWQLGPLVVVLVGYCRCMRVQRLSTGHVLTIHVELFHLLHGVEGGGGGSLLYVKE